MTADRTLKDLLASGRDDAVAIAAHGAPPLTYAGLRALIERICATLNDLEIGLAIGSRSCCRTDPRWRRRFCAWPPRRPRRGGKVALVHATAALTCGTSAGNCSGVATVRDLLGYGTATDYESGVAPALTNTTALARASGGCSDTDANDTDFTAESPSPRNTAAAATTCGGSGGSGGASASQSAGIVVNVQSSISLSLERTAVNFGTVTAGDRPTAVSERVSVTSNDPVGYLLTVHRTAFTPADLPLGITAAAPAGAQLAGPFAGGALVALLTTSDLMLGTSSTRSATGGDAWPTSLAFTAPIPAVTPGAYSATIVYTVIGGTIG